MMVIFLFVYFLAMTKASQCLNDQHCASCDTKGKCSSKCNDGYYGPKCDIKCSIGCNQTVCLLQNSIGKCTHGCNAGFTGEECRKIPCSKDNKTCRKCPEECKGGFCQLKSSCAQGCQDSYYGTTCKSCPGWCEVCNRVSGTCEVCLHCKGDCSTGCKEECEVGYFGTFCEHPCSSKCMSGCDQISGDCVECKSGWFGASCNKQCPKTCSGGVCYIDGTCSNGGTTVEAPQYWIAGFCLFLFIILVVVVYVTYHFKRIQNNLNKVNWEASLRTRDAEQEDARSFNTVPSINLESEQDMSQVGVQVVVLKHDDTSSGSLVSVEDEIVDKRVPGREHLRQGIVDVPSGSDTIKKLGGAQKKGGSIEICNADCDLKNDTKIIVENYSECDDVIACRNMKEDEEGIVSSNDAMFIGGKAKWR